MSWYRRTYKGYLHGQCDIRPNLGNWPFLVSSAAIGVRLAIAIPSPSRPRAKRIAEQYEAAAKAKGNPQKVRENFAALYNEFFNDDLPHSTVRQFVTRWLRDRKRETSHSTYVVYEATTNRFLKFLSTGADRDLGNVTKTQITDYRNQLADKLAISTVNPDIKIIRSIFGQARRDGYLFQDPAEGVSIIKRREAADLIGHRFCS